MLVGGEGRVKSRLRLATNGSDLAFISPNLRGKCIDGRRLIRLDRRCQACMRGLNLRLDSRNSGLFVGEKSGRLSLLRGRQI